MTRFYRDKDQLGAPVFMLHSNCTDGSSFYTADGKGLACYLARQGYDVFVADLRGKGKSWPHISGHSKYGNHQLINEDIPALLESIQKKRGATPQIWIGHGWGGVLMSSFYARYGDRFGPVAKMVQFAVRRKTSTKKSPAINFMWRKLSPLLIAINGYLPAKKFRLGIANESAANVRDFLNWSDSDCWTDPEDNFSYDEAARQQSWPASYYFAAKGDKAYGHPDDVRHFMFELGSHDGRMMVLSRKDGNLRDYGHTEIISHEDAEKDHFPLLLAWLERN
jgi:predicted alpha/beta hydrolase